MRTILIALLGFAAGALLVLCWPDPTMAPSTTGQPAMAVSANAASNASAADSQTADNNDADNNNAWPDHAPSPEQVLYAQPRMMRDALAALTPRVAGKPNLYVLAFAGDGSEDVFRNETEYAAKLFAKRFGGSVHTLLLENNPATLATHPLADWSNLESGLAGLHKAMHPEQDILLLYLSSHGSEDHTLLVDMDPLPLDQIGATDLAGILKEYPFKWKVVVVNACYSGGFIPPLRSAGTMVLTAARTDRSSFGCGTESDLTYFGHAWLVDALNHTDNFVDAFKQASGEISQWEQHDQLTPSEPQIDIGKGITTQLARWRSGITPGPAVPFKPATPATTSSALPPDQN